MQENTALKTNVFCAGEAVKSKTIAGSSDAGELQYPCSCVSKGLDDLDLFDSAGDHLIDHLAQADLLGDLKERHRSPKALLR